MRFIQATSYFFTAFFNKLTPAHISLLVLLLVSWVLLSSHLWHGDILFHTDLARDFLVLQDILETKNPTLIGPRSGGIPGVFHGPLWYYMSLVPFAVVQGSPALMGWFWWSLAVLSTIAMLFTVYWFTKNKTLSIGTAIGFSFIAIPFSVAPVNNYLADLFAFVVFAVWLQWLLKPKMLLAALGWFGLGLLVQFQMAFAIPIAVLWFPVFVYYALKQKNIQQILSVVLFTLPLLSFLVFELRHDWLQVRSVLIYLQTPSTADISTGSWVAQRIESALTDGLNIFELPKYFAILPLLAIGAAGLWKKKKKPLLTYLTILVLLWYFGWWLLAFGFSGTVWGYYFTPFAGIIVLGLAIFSDHVKWAPYLLVVLFIWLAVQRSSAVLYTPDRFGGASWVLLSEIAAEALSEPNRGYFVYSQDQFAYPLKYALSYYADTHSAASATAYTKLPQTVLVKAPDDPKNPYSTAQDWQMNKIGITSEATQVIEYPYGYTIEVFTLTETELNSPVDPNLILDLHFR